MEELSTQDWINLTIAGGTCIAALGSLIAAHISSKAARKAAMFSNWAARKEQDRWLTDLLFSLASQCNECVTSHGAISSKDYDLSKMATILCNSIDLIDRESDKKNKSKHLKNLWIFLNSAIWHELKTKQALDELKVTPSHTIATISSQYEKIRNELIMEIEPY